MLQHCRDRELVVEFKFRGDLYAVSDRLYIRHISDKATPVDPRAVLKLDGGSPFLDREDLDRVALNLDDKALFRVSSARGGARPEGPSRRLLTWDAMVERLVRAGGDPGAVPAVNLKFLMEQFGQLEPGVVEAAVREARAGAGTFGQALVKLGACTVQDLLAVALGERRVMSPRHHFGNQIGQILLDMGAIGKDALEAALVRQVAEPRPLVELLRAGVSAGKMQQAIEALETLGRQEPRRDEVGEILCFMGAISQTELAHAREEGRAKRMPVGKALRERGSVTGEAYLEAVKRQEIKRAARLSGDVRLGSCLVRLGSVDERSLVRALVAQIEDQRPLGEILISLGCCTPEQVIAGLALQEEELDRLVTERLPTTLEHARAERARSKTIGFKRGAPTGKLPQLDGLEIPAVLRRPPVLGLGALALIASLAIIFVVLPRLATPGQRAPMAKAISGASSGKGKVLSSLTAANTYEVDMDDVMRRIEDGDGNPLGAARTRKVDVDDVMRRIERGDPDPLAAVRKDPVLDRIKRDLSGASASLLPQTPRGSFDIEVDDVLQALEPRRGAGAAGPGAAKGRKPPVGVSMQDMRKVVQASVTGGGAGVAGVGGSAAGAIPAVGGPLAQPAAGDPQLLPEEREADRFMVIGKPHRAAQLYLAALKRLPDEAELLRKLGIAYSRLGRFKQAEEALLRAAKLSPQDSQLLTDLAAARLASGNYGGAVTAYRMAIQAEPRNALCHNQLGLALKAQGKEDEAEEAFGAAAKLDPDNGNSHFHLGLLLSQRDEKKARWHLDRAGRSFGRMVEDLMGRGEEAAFRRDLSGAIQGFEAALKANYSLVETQEAIARIHLAKGRRDEGREMARAAIATYQTGGIAHARMGDAYAALAEPQAAIEQWLTATRVAPFYAPPFLRLGQVFRSLGKRHAARGYLEAAVSADPKGAMATVARRDLLALGVRPGVGGR